MILRDLISGNLHLGTKRNLMDFGTSLWQLEFASKSPNESPLIPVSGKSCRNFLVWKPDFDFPSKHLRPSASPAIRPLRMKQFAHLQAHPTHKVPTLMQYPPTTQVGNVCVCFCGAAKRQAHRNVARFSQAFFLWPHHHCGSYWWKLVFFPGNRSPRKASWRVCLLVLDKRHGNLSWNLKTYHLVI